MPAGVLDHPPLPAGHHLIRELGRGATGAVYLTRQEPGGAERAIKVILPASLTARLRKVFHREALVQARLDHPHIVRLHDMVEATPGIFCLIMEHVDGQDAGVLLAERGRPGLDPALAVDIVAQGLLGLGHAHARQIVHRDVKDDNLLLTRDGSGALRAKLADFGLAKSTSPREEALTGTGEFGGTLPYLAPEQLRGYRDVGPAADLYSMGVVLYRLLSGAYPLDVEGAPDWISMILTQPPVPLRDRAAHVPERLARAVERALSKDPAARPPSAEAMRDEILAGLAGPGWAP